MAKGNQNRERKVETGKTFFNHNASADSISFILTDRGVSPHTQFLILNENKRNKDTGNRNRMILFEFWMPIPRL